MIGNQTWLLVKARKFYCINACCTRKVFTERFTEYIVSRKSKTKRVNEKLLKIALLMGGNGGVRISRLMNIPASSSTLIRLIHQQPLEQNSSPKILGIDDWAFKKRERYGTVIVDLEKRKIIDLLPDREAETVEKWLKMHPGVEVVSRDRFTNFANGIKNASSTIIQVADRWHLLKNLGDAMQKVLDRNVINLKANRSRQAKEIHFSNDTPVVQKKDDGIVEGILRKKFVLVKQMLAEGYEIRKISRDTGIARNTIRKWKCLEILPPKRSPTMTNMHLYDEIIRKIINKNPKVETKEVLNQIREMGYNGSQSIAYENIRRIRGPKSKEYVSQQPSVFWVPPKTGSLFYIDKQKLSRREKEFVDNLIQDCEEVKTATELIQGFKNMLKEHNGELLSGWIELAISSNIKEIKGFAKGLRTDLEAVKNGIELQWSNGPVEGQVNKLKVIKRQMYGRASFELLRKRMVNHQS